VTPDAPSVAATHDGPRSARLVAYGWWQLRDYLLEKGIGTALVMLFAGSIAYVGARGMTRFSPEALRAPLSLVFTELFGQLVLLGVLFATNGIVSDDRKHGYYRFLFAKPVSVPRFYLQKFVAHLVGFLLVAALLVLAFNLAFTPMLNETGLPFMSRRVFPLLAVLFVALGGIGFLMSVLWRIDWLSFMFVYIVSSVFWDMFGDSDRWQGTVVRALPPVHTLDGIYRSALGDGALPIGDLRWLVLYGLGCLVAGVVALRLRPLTSN
jgi:hypothetical protein